MRVKFHIITGSCAIEDQETRIKRFAYDPRAPSDRKPRTLKEMDIEGLRAATNGKAGILCYLPVSPHKDYQMPCLDDANVVAEVVATECEPQQVAVLPPTLLEMAKNVEESLFLQEVLKPLSQQEVDLISISTKEQAESDLWFKYRTGRITASKLYTVSKKVNLSTGVISQRNESIIKDIMCYTSGAYSPAIHWGKYNEPIAIEKFLKLNRRRHKSMVLKQCGVILVNDMPIIAASPDAIVECACCGSIPLEVKNPYKFRGLSINKLAEQPDSCLQITSCGQIKLKADHPYYCQVQAQTLATCAETGYFAVKTASPYNNFHWEEICFDPMYLEDVIAKAAKFFEVILMPEIIHGYVKKQMETDTNDAANTSSATPCMQPNSLPALVSSAIEYECNVCHGECIDDPKTFDDMSIHCDYCKRWYHWICVNVKGDELFLRRKALKWSCPACTS